MCPNVVHFDSASMPSHCSPLRPESSHTYRRYSYAFGFFGASEFAYPMDVFIGLFLLNFKIQRPIFHMLFPYMNFLFRLYAVPLLPPRTKSLPRMKGLRIFFLIAWSRRQEFLCLNLAFWNFFRSRIFPISVPLNSPWFNDWPANFAPWLSTGFFLFRLQDRRIFFFSANGAHFHQTYSNWILFFF